MREISQALNDAASKFVSQGGRCLFKHGEDYSVSVDKSDGNRERSLGQVKCRSAEFELRDASVAEGDFSQIDAFVASFSNQMAGQMEASIVSEMVAATNDKPAVGMEMLGDIRAGLCAVLDSITPSLNADLSLAEPSFLFHPNLAPKLEEAFKRLEQDHPDFKYELALIRKRRHLEALITYFENISKFRLNDDDRSTTDHLLQRLRQLLDVALHAERRQQHPSEPGTEPNDLPEGT